MDKVKLYCYADETGQDTKGDLFIVVVIILQGEKDELERYLENIEIQSGKGRRKWIKSRDKEKFTYLSLFQMNQQFHRSVFYSEYDSTTEYERMTVETIENAINQYLVQHTIADYKATIVIDGLSQKVEQRVAASLRKAGLQIRKVRGEKDDSNAFLRLSDAIAGSIREAKQADNVARKYIIALSREKKLIEVRP
jgi:Protein of unknown function (DUF3800)